MPSVAVKLYSVYFKLILKHKLQSLLLLSQQNPKSSSFSSSFGITSRSDESTAPSSPTFSSADGVATKDIHIDPLTSLSIRIFLPSQSISPSPNNYSNAARRSSYSDGGSNGSHHDRGAGSHPRRSSYDGVDPPYRGYLPLESNRPNGKSRKLPIVLQFHGGAFVLGSNVSVANDLFCRRIAKLLDVIVIAVGYRLAPESRYPAAFADGMKVLNWVGKQANLAECSKSLGGGGGGKRGGEGRRAEEGRRIVDTFGAASVEPWLAAHGDPLR